MTGTPGRAACIAWNEHYAKQHSIEARNEWAASDPRGRAAWEAAAKAGAADVTAERDRLREGITALATEMHAEADRITPHSSQPDELPGMADVIRAQALHECAASIRQILGPEAS